MSAGNAFTTYNAPGLSYPAASPYVVPVMSVTDGGALASYSQRDVRGIAAPGSAIRSTVPDYKGNNNGITDDYANFSGTSMASPYIAGASVLVRQAMEFAGYTNITQDTIYNHMMSTGTAFVDSVTGLTFKRLNLSAAIDALMPTDDFGSTVATAYSMGSLTTARSFDGTIGTVSDADYFTFTASSNGRVTFAVSDATHNMDAAWTLSNGTGTLSNNGDTFAFDVLAGQTYSVGLSSSGGIGHYSLDVSAQSSFTYTDWGSISFSQLNSLSVSGEAWYRVTASQAGYLTVEGLYAAQSGQVSMQLYNTSMQTVATGNAVNGTCRVDAYATAGQQFYVRVLGTNSNVNYRLSNLVSLAGTTVNIGGTSGNDTFAFSAGNTHTVTVNGVTHTFSAIAVNAFNFDGGSGTDTITMIGTSGDEIATLRVGTANLTGTGFAVTTTSTEFATVYSSGGVDTAILYDSAGNDFYTTKTTITSMTGTGYQNVAVAFTRTFGYASTGDDTGQLYDGATDDQFYAHPDYAVLNGGNNQFYNYAAGFDRLYAMATGGGNDKAYMYDGVSNDEFIGTSTYSVLRGTNNEFYRHASGFDEVTAYSNVGGNDIAYLYDSAGNDQFLGRHDYALLKSQDNTFSNVAGRF